MKTVRIINREFGFSFEDEYDDKTQFQIFLNMVHSALSLKNDLSFFNGKDFLVHIPYEVLKGSVIFGSSHDLSLGEYAIVKSKMEGADVKG